MIFVALKKLNKFLILSFLLIHFSSKNIEAKTRANPFNAPKIYNNFYRFSIPQHPNIKKWISFFTTKKGKRIFKNWVKSSRQHSGFINRSIKRRNMPPVLAYLPMIESGFYVHAHSSAGAMGYWQFMNATAKRFNLKITSWIDERKNINKSTQAALNYLEILYKRFKKWDLALAAYNMGENRLSRFIKKHKTNNYWELINKSDFPKETKHYVPKLVAIGLLLQQPQFYGLKINKQPYKNKKFNYISIVGGTSLKELAQNLNIKSSYLKKINPELKQFKIPNYVKSYAVRIPPKSFQTIENYFKQ